MLTPGSWIRWQVIAPLVLLAALIAFLIYRPGDVYLPQQLGSLTLTSQISGDEARATINRMHGKAVTPKENWIGQYSGRMGEATLYVSVYANPRDARDADERMSALVNKGGAGFGHYQRLILNGMQVAFCVGFGQEHYFFRDHSRLYWLAVDPPISSETARHLILTLRGNALNAGA